MKKSLEVRLSVIFKFARLSVFAAAAVLVLTRCGSNSGENQASPPSLTSPGSFGDVYKVIQSSNCVQCHAPGAPAHDDNGVTLDFTSRTTAYSTLMNSSVSGQSSTGICAGIRIIAPGSPDHSYLEGVLSPTYRRSGFAGNPSCLPYDHTTDTNLSAAEQASITQWINANGPNN